MITVFGNHAVVHGYAVIAPQYFDANLKGTLRYLARIGHKKVLFVELDEVCSLLARNQTIAVE